MKPYSKLSNAERRALSQRFWIDNRYPEAAIEPPDELQDDEDDERLGGDAADDRYEDR